MHIGTNTDSHYYLTNNGIKKEIEVSKKDLGVWVNNELNLKWSDQCGKAAGKAMSVLRTDIAFQESWSYQKIIETVRLSFQIWKL